MKLPKELLAQAVEALHDGFDPSTLQRMVRIYLERDIDNISTKPTFESVVFDLVTWAERSDLVGTLVHGAQESNPTNVKLQDLAHAFDRWELGSIGYQDEQLLRCQ